MDFLKNMHDTILGFSHETRMALAMAIMGISVLSFFYVWYAVIPSRLISLSPIPPTVTGVETTNPTQITMAGPFEPAPAGGVAPRTDTSEDALTPAKGIVGTLAGLGGLFAPSSQDQSSLSIGRSLSDFGGSIIRGAMRLYGLAVHSVVRAMDVFLRMSTGLVAPNY